MYQPTIVFPTGFTFFGYNFPMASQDKPGGMIRRTYVRNHMVIQISPAATDNMPDSHRYVLAPWLNHATRIEKMTETIHRAERICSDILVGGDWKIGVPDIIPDMSGTLTQNGLTFPIIASTLVTGISLEDNRWASVTTRPQLEADHLLQGLITFLSRLHQQPTMLLNGNLCRTSNELRDYYRERLDAIDHACREKEFVRSIGDNALNTVRRLFDYISESLSETVTAEERLGIIHGDFRENNLLIDPDQRRCWIIDFDQGLLPGDKASDLWKFGLLQFEPGRMSSMLSQELYTILLQQYKIASQNDPTTIFLEHSTKMIRHRIELLLFDVSISILLLRYNLGWNFVTDTIDGQLVRGTSFIIQLIQKQHDRVVNQ